MTYYRHVFLLICVISLLGCAKKNDMAGRPKDDLFQLSEKNVFYNAEYRYSDPLDETSGKRLNAVSVSIDRELFEAAPATDLVEFAFFMMTGINESNFDIISIIFDDGTAMQFYKSNYEVALYGYWEEEKEALAASEILGKYEFDKDKNQYELHLN